MTKLSEKLLPFQRKSFYIYLFFFSLLITFMVTLPQPTFALKIKLEESPDPPKGVEIPPEDQLNPSEPVQPAPAQKPSETAPAAAPSAPTASQAEAPGTPPLHGIFRVWEPLQNVFPLKNASITSNITNLLNDRAWNVFFSRYNAAGSYYLEGGKTIGFLKNFNAKTQYNHQIQTNITTNKMTGMSAVIARIQTKYSRITNQTVQFQSGAGSKNITDNRKLAFSHQLNSKVTLGFDREENLTRGVSANPAKTTNRKGTYTLEWNISDKRKLTLSHGNVSNRDLINGNVSKIVQTDLKYAFPVWRKFGMELGYQFLNNRASQPNSPGENENRKSTRSLGFTYQLSPDMKLVYLLSNIIDRQCAPGIFTNYSSTIRELQLQQTITPWLNFNGKNTVSFSGSTGKTAIREGTFNLDHQNISLLPGNTSVQLRKNLSRSGDRSNPTSNENYTISVNTPLKYFGGRLTVSHLYNYNQTGNLSNTGEQRNLSVIRKYEGAYKVTQSLSISNSLNNVENTTMNLSGQQTPSNSMNRTLTNSATLQVKFPFTKSYDLIPSMNFSHRLTRNMNDTYSPGVNKDETIVVSNSGVFNLKGNNWNGSYTLERSVNKAKTGQFTRATQNKLLLNHNSFYGFKFDAAISLASQKNGGTSSGVLKMTRQLNPKSILSFSYQYNKNQVCDNRLNNTFDRTFVLLVEITL